MSKDWFEKWFDTRYYHILYSNRDDAEANKFIGCLTNFLELEKGSEIIDIGCGRGRHALILSQMGYSVTGIDIAPTSIDYAKQFENDHLHFFCFDKRKIFRNEEYDLALNLFTSFGYLKNRDELAIALKSMAQNLKKGGKIVLDYLNSEIIRHQSFHKEHIELEGVNFTTNKYIKGHQIFKEIHIEENGNTSDFVEQVHLITLEEFEDLFESASLKILHTFGDYNLKPYSPEESIRLILIAEKE